jgi:hypothetical protein
MLIATGLFVRHGGAKVVYREPAHDFFLSLYLLKLLYRQLLPHREQEITGIKSGVFLG